MARDSDVLLHDISWEIPPMFTGEARGVPSLSVIPGTSQRKVEREDS